MRGFKPFPLLGLGLIFCALLMSGCSEKTPQNGASPLNISTQSLPMGAEGDSYSQTFQAYGGTAPYTWSLDSGALPPGFSLNSGGVFSGTPPTGSAGTYNFTVRVTDSQSPVKAYQTGSFTMTINPPLSFSPQSPTLPGAVIGVAYTSTVVGTSPASPNGGIPPYTYTVINDSGCLFTNTANCSSNGGLTLNGDGSITGTPTGPSGTFAFTVQVTDSFPTTATANFGITVTGKIQGNYAFSFNGYNQQGQAFYMAGSFVADGSGNITSGMLDRNGNDLIGAVQCSLTGSYTINATTNLGTMTLVIPCLGTYTYGLTVSVVSDSRFIEVDPNLWGSGVLRSQGASLAGISLTAGNFAFGSSGVDAGGSPYAGAGFFITDANGNINSGSCMTPPCGLADINDNDTVQSQASLSGSLSSFDLATGRGTATFTIGSSTVNYAYYVVAPTAGKLFPSLFAVQTDAVSSGAPVTLASIAERGPAGGATTIFSNLYLNATRGNATNGAVFELNAVSSSGGTPVPDISLGLGNFDGNGNITSYALDENNGGTLTQPSYSNATYNVDKNSGRVAVSGLGPYPPVWYLVGFNTGFVVGTDPSVTSGAFEPQTVPQPIFITALFGNFYGGTASPVLSTVTNEVEAALATPPPPPGSGNGTFTATFDTSGSGGMQMNQMFSGAFCISDNNSCPSTQQAQSATGRMLILDSNGNTVDILYLVSASATGSTSTNVKNVTLSTGADPALTVLVH